MQQNSTHFSAQYVLAIIAETFGSQMFLWCQLNSMYSLAIHEKCFTLTVKLM